MLGFFLARAISDPDPYEETFDFCFCDIEGTESPCDWYMTAGFENWNPEYLANFDSSIRIIIPSEVTQHSLDLSVVPNGLEVYIHGHDGQQHLKVVASESKGRVIAKSLSLEFTGADTPHMDYLEILSSDFYPGSALPQIETVVVDIGTLSLDVFQQLRYQSLIVKTSTLASVNIDTEKVEAVISDTQTFTFPTPMTFCLLEAIEEVTIKKTTEYPKKGIAFNTVSEEKVPIKVLLEGVFVESDFEKGHGIKFSENFTVTFNTELERGCSFFVCGDKSCSNLIDDYDYCFSFYEIGPSSCAGYVAFDYSQWGQYADEEIKVMAFAHPDKSFEVNLNLELTSKYSITSVDWASFDFGPHTESIDLNLEKVNVKILRSGVFSVKDMNCKDSAITCQNFEEEYKLVVTGRLEIDYNSTSKAQIPIEAHILVYGDELYNRLHFKSYGWAISHGVNENPVDIPVKTKRLVFVAPPDVTLTFESGSTVPGATFKFLHPMATMHFEGPWDWSTLKDGEYMEVLDGSTVNFEGLRGKGISWMLNRIYPKETNYKYCISSIPAYSGSCQGFDSTVLTESNIPDVLDGPIAIASTLTEKELNVITKLKGDVKLVGIGSDHLPRPVISKLPDNKKSVLILENLAIKLDSPYVHETTLKLKSVESIGARLSAQNLTVDRFSYSSSISIKDTLTVDESNLQEIVIRDQQWDLLFNNGGTLAVLQNLEHQPVFMLDSSYFLVIRLQDSATLKSFTLDLSRYSNGTFTVVFVGSFHVNTFDGETITVLRHSGLHIPAPINMPPTALWWQEVLIDHLEWYNLSNPVFSEIGKYVALGMLLFVVIVFTYEFFKHFKDQTAGIPKIGAESLISDQLMENA